MNQTENPKITIETQGVVRPLRNNIVENQYITTSKGKLEFFEDRFKFDKWSVPYENIDVAVLLTRYMCLIPSHTLIIDKD